ncbi:seizure protein 6-like isoform X2 [Gadus macrocephalus]|nr:seizure protein 6-like isoform X2 [Gadus macrocephalus]XP_059912124.1 seizure protein 6-like isoform X2 [Gadus macrocephalus]XP_059912125.1 seizure protein 6-like isoform X2 [Gadus macrocephalus]XP_059912126.1 seizure protein 6-like isoform X2 [Gadus macrocephalus]XP_059912127.1 seizure protein 6-like isoform X2 [Gadus macrocephalus]XP_059912128.1 seizure protein 6-like isoform X2 [Gadus macrocephalus]XP_059912129.1 seizure protein 6-like isoform X2 [Gadus macrocephalus]
MSDVTVQFQSDPATNIYGYNNGFVVHFFEVARNDTCSELPEISNGWKSTSHPDLIHGTVVTYQCYPGFELGGAEILMCQWDLSWSADVPRCDQVLTCPDPGAVEHGRRTLSAQRLSVGSTVQYACQKGYLLAGAAVLTCCRRDAAKPKWSDRLPKCVPERYEPCRNPGAPSTSVQSSEKAFYQAGESLTFSCHPGYELQGEPAIACVPGHPSQWNSTPPACKASTSKFVNERRLDVASPELDLEGSNVALVVLVPAVVVLLAVLAVYVYFTKLQGKSVRMPSSLPPYDNMTEESAFDNPVYERGHRKTHSTY